MNTNTATRLAAANADELKAIKRWAAEDFAVAIGLLRECPYHGRPFRVDQSQANVAAAAAKLPDARVALQAFDGNRSELLATAQRLARGYGHTCSECEAAAAQELFD